MPRLIDIARLAAALALSTLAIPIGVNGAAAQDEAAFYKGKTVRFVVGAGVGGGFDTYARMLAPHLAKALGATVIVENQPGAGGIIALNAIAAAQPDGLRIMLVNGTPLLLGQILETKNVRYDMTKLSHLGAISNEPWAATVRTDLPIKSPQDLVKYGKQIRWGATGPIGGPSDGAALTCEALKIDCRIIAGYRGSSDIALAMQRGEIDGLYITDGSAARYRERKQAHVVGIGARERSKLMPDVPTFHEAVKLSPQSQWWLDVRAELNDFGRVLVTTPGVPADRLAFLRAAIKKVLTDPVVLAEADKRKRELEYRDPEVLSKLATKLINGIDAKQKAAMREVVLKKYYGK
jgi:tripartite-type tricarboxylate transporter receptor subunit TctC